MNHCLAPAENRQHQAKTHHSSLEESAVYRHNHQATLEVQSRCCCLFPEEESGPAGQWIHYSWWSKDLQAPKQKITAVVISGFLGSIGHVEDSNDFRLYFVVSCARGRPWTRGIRRRSHSGDNASNRLFHRCSAPTISRSVSVRTTSRFRRAVPPSLCGTRCRPSAVATVFVQPAWMPMCAQKKGKEEA